jgi:beta-phosphoglucomutase-like phosphatase (HAD superfamily)
VAVPVEKGRLLAVCFDFSGVIVDHRDKRPLPGMGELVRELHACGRLLAVVSRYGEETVAEHLGEELCRCFRKIYSARDRSKLECVTEFAGECGIGDLSAVAFVDDKPQNLQAVAGSPVRVIGFRGSGKYDTAGACREIGVPFAGTVSELRGLLGL